MTTIAPDFSFPVSGTTALIILVTSIVIFTHWLSLLIHKRRSLPPGPWGYPLFGAIPRLISKTPQNTFQKWWTTYGDVYSLYMGSRFCIVLNGVEIMKESFMKQGDIFNGRPWNLFKKLAGNKGIVFTEGPVWQEQRRFTLQCLRDLGMGKSSFEHQILEESRLLTEEFQKHGSDCFEPSIIIAKAVSNNIGVMIYGARSEYDDPEFDENIRALDQSVRSQSLVTMMQFAPWLEFLTKLSPVGKRLFKNVKRRADYAQKQIEEHRKTFCEENPRNFIDAYFMNMRKMERENKESSFSESHLHRIIQDLFIAGTETVTVTLRWSLLFLALHPEVQCAGQVEIMNVIGQSRAPTMMDKKKMPVMSAIIMESQRLGNIALFSVPRCVSEETELNGFHIPKGTWVFTNRWGAHMNTRYWNEPHNFDYTRFLNPTGTSVITPPGFIPFGIGARNCLGESLAKMELFLMLTSILQKFSISLPADEPSPNLQPRFGINMSPDLYKIQVQPYEH